MLRLGTILGSALGLAYMTATASLAVAQNTNQGTTQNSGPAPATPPAGQRPEDPGAGAAAPSPMLQPGSLSAQAREEYNNQPKEPPSGYDLSRFDSRPKRSGFTLELGLGLSLTRAETDGDPGTAFGLAPPSLSLGGFVARDVAVMFRTAGTTWFEEDVYGDTVVLSSRFYGPAVQWWPSRTVFISGGLGLGVLSTRWFGWKEVETGFMLTGRVGYSFYTTKYHSFALVGELFPAFYDEQTVLGATIQLQWQLF